MSDAKAFSSEELFTHIHLQISVKDLLYLINNTNKSIISSPIIIGQHFKKKSQFEKDVVKISVHNNFVLIL